MTIELTESVIGVWNASFTGGDWLAAASHIEDDRIAIKYRFRYHADDKTFDSKDVKHWYTAEVTDPTEDVIKVIRTMAKCVCDREGGDTLYYELLRSECASFEAFMELFIAAPFIHIKTGDEAEKYLEEGK